MKDIIKGSALSLVSKVLSASITVLFTLAITNLLPSDEAGTYLFFITLVLIISNLSRFGIDKHIVKTLSTEEITYSDRVKIINSFSSLITFTLITSSLFSIILYLYIKSFTLLAFSNFDLKNISHGLTAIPFYTVCLLVANYYQVVKKSSIYILSLNFFQQASTLLLITFVYYSTNNVGLEDVVSCYIVGCFISSLYLSISFVKRYSEGINRFRPTLNIIKESIRSSIPLFVVVIFNLMLNWSTQIILAYHSTPTEVSIYTVSLRLVMLISFILVAVNSVTAPKYAFYFKREDLNSIKKVYKFSLFLSLSFSIVTSLFYIILGRELLGFFGDTYIASYEILLVMMVGQIINVLTGSVSYLLQMKGDYKKVMVINIVAGIVSLPLGFLLVSFYGIYGAAIAYSLSISILNLLLLSQAMKVFK